MGMLGEALTKLNFWLREEKSVQEEADWLCHQQSRAPARLENTHKHLKSINVDILSQEFGLTNKAFLKGTHFDKTTGGIK